MTITETGVVAAKVGAFLILAGDTKAMTAARQVNGIFYAGAQDLPRGRREEMRRAFGEAAQQIANVQTSETLATVKTHRRRPRMLPEVAFVANSSLNTAKGRC